MPGKGCGRSLWHPVNPGDPPPFPLSEISAASAHCARSMRGCSWFRKLKGKEGVGPLRWAPSAHGMIDGANGFSGPFPALFDPPPPTPGAPKHAAQFTSWS